MESEAKAVGGKFKKKKSEWGRARTIHEFFVNLLFGRAGARCRYRHEGEYESEHEHGADSHGGARVRWFDRVCDSARTLGRAERTEQRPPFEFKYFLKIRWDLSIQREKEFF